ncbi:hypothetical protein ACFVUB_23900 [Streptomyces niveus]|uniref:hypothetical protein n=1 Tax=Streptomyces niveus TaxID=193462 RepID=UPI0036D7BDF7
MSGIQGQPCRPAFLVDLPGAVFLVPTAGPDGWEAGPEFSLSMLGRLARTRSAKL